MGFWVGLALMCLLSGLIAYLGDLIGRRIGRKRLTFLGLRPRNTAILFTVVTGMLIALLAVGVVLAVSRDVQNRVLRYDAIISDLERQAERQRGLAARRKTQLAGVEEQRRAAEAAKQQAERDLVEATRSVTLAEAVERSALAAQRRAEEQARQAGAQAAVKARELAAAEQAVNRARKDLQSARARRQEAEAKLSRSQQRLDELIHAIGEKERELQAKIDEVRNAERVAIPLINEYRKKLEDLEAELKEARRERMELLEEALHASRGAVIFGRDSELGRRRIEAGLSELEIRDRLNTFIRELDRKARDKGAGPDADDRYAVPLHIDEEGRPVPLDVFLPAVARRLKQQGEAVWLRAVTLVNIVEGRPAYYAFEYYVDKLVFFQDQVIAAAEIDGSLDEPAIARALEGLVKEKVQPEAERRGMLPTNERVGLEIWFPALRLVKEAAGPVTVEVLASRNIRIGDPLAIYFQVGSDDKP